MGGQRWGGPSGRDSPYRGADAPGARLPRGVDAWVRLRQIRSAVDPDLRLLANHAV
ncbi:MAG: hypothetical protein GYA85_09980 [Propionibacterium sp.]|nr:hypothetical protein [Propionibacterium sp.]